MDENEFKCRSISCHLFMLSSMVFEIAQCSNIRKYANYDSEKKPTQSKLHVYFQQTLLDRSSQHHMRYLCSTTIYIKINTFIKRTMLVGRLMRSSTIILNQNHHFRRNISRQSTTYYRALSQTSTYIFTHILIRTFE